MSVIPEGALNALIYLEKKNVLHEFLYLNLLSNFFKIPVFYGKTSKRELAISNFIRKLNEIELDTYDDDKAKTFKIRRVEKTEERENG